jgi:hypothetical protein
MKDELNFILQHSKINKDVEFEDNEEIKEEIISLHLLHELLDNLMTLRLPLPISNEEFHPLSNRPQSWN